MAKLKAPLLSFSADGRLGPKTIYVTHKGRTHIKRPAHPRDARTTAQLSHRILFFACSNAWHLLTPEEKQAYALIDPKAWPNPAYQNFMKECLMAGLIDAHLYGWDGDSWEALQLDANKYLKVNAIGTDALLAGGLPSALDTDALKVREQGTPGVHLYGYDGSNWQTLLVESAALKNLRTRLYAGANAIAASILTTPVSSAHYGLVTIPVEQFYNVDTPTWLLQLGYNDADGRAARAGKFYFARLQGYNGSAWDRLRTYPTGILKVGRAEIPSTTVRKTAAGAVVAGARKLYWIACSPGSPSAEWELTDAIAGGGTVVYDHFDSDKHSEHLIFDPPMKFNTGIWIEKFDHMHSLVFCYI